MNKHLDHTEECGPVIACGASAVYINHDPDEPTSIDRLVAALKRLVKGERTSARSAYGRTLQPQRRGASAH